MSAQTYAILVEFVGTKYRGWQRQETVPSIQETLEDALSRVANHTIEVVATGRTDAGVHASCMVCHFVSPAKRSLYAWRTGVNSLLPDDIAITQITPMSDDFHARFGARYRRYRYITLNSQVRPAILANMVAHVHTPLDIARMQEASAYLLGMHNFNAFRAAACQSKQPVRFVHHAILSQVGNFLVFDIKADGFLHHMVRNLMGALFAVGCRALAPDDIPRLIASQDRRLCPPTAPACGLYFVDAGYDAPFDACIVRPIYAPSWLGLPLSQNGA